jgi:hypothetical protein
MSVKNSYEGIERTPFRIITDLNNSENLDARIPPE